MGISQENAVRLSLNNKPEFNQAGFMHDILHPGLVILNGCTLGSMIEVKLLLF